MLKLYLTDAPGEFSEVNITFSEISVKSGDTWITVNNEEEKTKTLAVAKKYFELAESYIG